MDLPNDNAHAVQVKIAGSTMFTSNEVPFSEIIAVPLPEKTDTYQPLSNLKQINMVKASFESRGFELSGERYGLSCKGKRMVSLLSWSHPDMVNQDMALFSATLNSYDKSTAAATALGAKVFVCENLCISGDIKVVRRHTLNVVDDFEYLVEDAAEQALPMYVDLSKDLDLFKRVEIDQQIGFHLMGEAHGLWGEKGAFLSPTQINSAVRAWKTPLHESFEDRNLWSWYQACNEALKKSPAHEILRRHAALHKFTKSAVEVFGKDLLISEE